MLKTFARRLSRRIGNVLKFLSTEDLDESLLDQEKNLYKRGIIREGRNLAMAEEDYANYNSLLEAVERIGCLAYTGGPPATKCAGQFIPQLCELLTKPNARGDLVIATLKSLSIICFNHSEHQDFCHSNGLLRTLSELISKSVGGTLYWSIYCLYNLIVDNIKNLQTAAEDTSFHQKLITAEEFSWLGFSNNYATISLKLLGLKSVSDIKNKEL